MTGTIYTFGYGKLKTAEDLKALLEASDATGKIDIVLDVRAMPTGRNVLWRKGLMPDTLAKAGINDYLHVPALGNPDFRGSAPAYRLTDEPKGMAILMDVLNSGRSAALVCVCAETAHCHRRLIVAKARAIEPTIKLVELEVGKDPLVS